MPETKTEPTFDRCNCGRLMSLVLGVSKYPDDDAIEVLWCARCGEVNIHYLKPGIGDSRYSPDRKLGIN